jgi:hypothetical protein
MSIGWIKIHREIQEHWIFTDPIKFKWWIILLMKVNHKEGEILLGNKVYKIKKGQSAFSIRSWAIAFNCSTKTVSSFFELLKNSEMIIIETLGKWKQSTTLVTVCNYDKYQSIEETPTPTRFTTPTPTQKKHEGNTDGIQSKNVENEKNGKEDNIYSFDFKKSLSELCSNKQLISDWLKIRKVKKAVNTETAFNGFIREQEKSNLSVEEVLTFCVEKSWSGFKSEWVKSLISQTNPVKQYNVAFVFRSGGYEQKVCTEEEIEAYLKRYPAASVSHKTERSAV